MTVSYSRGLFAHITLDGADAYGRGKLAEDNPWALGNVERAAWVAGWLNAQLQPEPDAPPVPPHTRRTRSSKEGLWTPEERAQRLAKKL